MDTEDIRRMAAAEYIRRLTGDENTSVTFQVFDDTPTKDPRKAHIYHGPLKQHFERLTVHNNDGCGIFCTVNETDLNGRGMANMTGVRAILADDDDGLNRMDGFPLRPHMAVLSSRSNGIEKKHFYWCTDGGNLATHHYDGIIERVIQDYKTCAGAKGLNRVLRLPGFYHQKDPNNRQLVKITHMTDDPPYSWDQIVKAFPPIGNGSSNKNKLQEAFNSDPILNHLRAGGFVKEEQPDGKIHIVCPFEESHTEKSSVSSTSYFVAHTNGYKHGHFKCQHAHCAHRTRADFLGAIGYATKEPGTEADPGAESQEPIVRAVSLKQICSAKVELRPIADGFINEGEKCIIHAEGGVGKSILSLNFSLSIASPLPLLWDKFPIPKQRTVLFVQSENGIGCLNERANKMCRGKPELARGLENVFFAGCDGGVELAGSATDKEFRSKILNCANNIGRPIDVIHYDPLISYHDADENDNSRMRTTLDCLAEIAERIGATPIVIHHDNKEGTIRGASAINDWARHRFHAFLIGNSNRIQLKNEKRNNAERLRPFILEMDSDLNFHHMETVDALNNKLVQRCQAVKDALILQGSAVETQAELVEQYKEISGFKNESTIRNHIKEAVSNGFIFCEHYEEDGIKKCKYRI